ncbi:hypothetical protein SHI21_17765 [Bacteriovorax sp. PP10]|uniref:Uncharacterized protein n=1 Tax=Bacteriovorax antarcticus TaxID=3088717 RepID=A0ABU5W1E9_9BACT|nr:hypothetical protein [Bacteriovorax sp. PP10]MEA9358085.1 hypothetical protein [Bacteriovorax sp. PP10]
MKTLMIICTLLFSLKVFALDSFGSKDSIKLFASGKATLEKEISVFDNPDTIGAPKYIINESGLIINRKIILYDQILKCELSNNLNKCSDEKIPDFVKAHYHVVSLAVEGNDNNILKVVENDKNYYLKMSEKDFKFSQWPDGSSWKVFSKTEAFTEFSKIMEKDQSLRDFFAGIKKCVKEKSIPCLIKYTKLEKNIQQMFKYREIAEDPKLCKEFLAYDGLNSWEDMEEMTKKYKIKDSPIVWNLLDDLLAFDKNKISIVLRTEKFKSAEMIDLSSNIDSKLACENTTNLTMEITKMENGNNTKEWKITFVKTYSRDTI